MPIQKTPILLATLWMMLAAFTTYGQQPTETDATRGGESYSRETILQSERWRKVERQFKEWLSVQKIYTPAQAAQLTTALEQQVAAMSARDLEDFLDDTEDRLAVLLSDEAMDARTYLSVFSEEGRQRLLAPDGAIPNVFGMTVSQLRQELRQFQQERSSRAATHAQYDRSREQAVTAIAQERSRRQDANLAMREQAMSSARAQRPSTFTSPYALMNRNIQNRTTAPSGLRRSLYVTPWGGIGTGYSW